MLRQTSRKDPAMAQGGADMRPTVAVMYFNNGALGVRNSELEPLSKGIADMMIGQLAVNSAIRVVERDQLQALLSEQKLSAEGKVDPSALDGVPRALPALAPRLAAGVCAGRCATKRGARRPSCVSVIAKPAVVPPARPACRGRRFRP